MTAQNEWLNGHTQKWNTFIVKKTCLSINISLNKPSSCCSVLTRLEKLFLLIRIINSYQDHLSFADPTSDSVNLDKLISADLTNALRKWVRLNSTCMHTFDIGHFAIIMPNPHGPFGLNTRPTLWLIHWLANSLRSVLTGYCSACSTKVIMCYLHRVVQ